MIVGQPNLLVMSPPPPSPLLLRRLRRTLSLSLSVCVCVCVCRLRPESGLAQSGRRGGGGGDSLSYQKRRAAGIYRSDRIDAASAARKRERTESKLVE